MRIGIVGAGIAGLACAARLKDNGIVATLFDKGRRPGGRLSSLCIGGLEWDFGAQYFKVSGAAFAAEVKRWHDRHLVAPWTGGPDGALVGMPSMGDFVAALCQEHDVRLGAEVQRIEADCLGWHVSGPDLCEGPFAALIIAAPSEQAATLVSLHDLDMARETTATRSTPCWTVMTAFTEPLSALPHYFRDRGPIAWASRNNSKPGRAPTECWVIQASAAWSRAHLERDPTVVAPLLLGAFAAEARADLPTPSFLRAHRWRFGLPYGQRGKVLWNPSLRLGACGDWTVAPAIEGAWQSGVSMAERVADALTRAEWPHMLDDTCRRLLAD